MINENEIYEYLKSFLFVIIVYGFVCLWWFSFSLLYERVLIEVVSVFLLLNNII